MTAEISDNANAEFRSKAKVGLLERKMDDKYTAGRENEYAPKVKGYKVICIFSACTLTQIIIPLK